MESLEHLFINNQKWAASMKMDNPHYFSTLAKQQKPKYLWIGCSDSRVPANQIINLQPGEIFVHRNIANLVVHTDLNCLSVLQYAVDILKIDHIIICGHYGCGGINAAIEDNDNGLIDNWLNHIKDTHRLHHDKFSKLDKSQTSDLLCEINVKEQVANIYSTNTIRKALNNGRDIKIHGWIYSIENGILKDLQVNSQENLPQ